MAWSVQLDAVRQDVGYAVRALRKTPTFTLAVALVLALGVGGTTAIFAVVNAVLLRPLPFPDPDRLALVRENFPTMGIRRATVSPGEFLAYQDGNTAFLGVAGFENWNLTLTEGGRAERLATTRVSANLFPLLRIAPLLGRNFSAKEETVGEDRVAILSHGLWTRRFGADPSVVGRIVHFDGLPYQVIGVLGAGVEFPLPGIIWSRPADLWTPLAYPPDARTTPASSMNTHVIGRLKPGVTFAAAEASVGTILRRLVAANSDYRARGTVETVEVLPLATEVLGPTRGSLLVLLGAVGLVLLIACANIAHLMLVRAGKRRTELAIRAALGAGRLRLARQLLAEALLLALGGGVAGLGVAAVGVRLLVALRPGDIPRLGESGFDFSVFAFALALAVFTGLGVGLRPALVASRMSGGDGLRIGQRARGTDRKRGGILVVTEVALALVLLVGTGLLLRSLAMVQRVDPGLSADGVLFARVYPGEGGYPTGGRVNQFYESVLERLRRLPGVERAALSSTMMVDDQWTAGYTIEDEWHGGEPNLRMARNALVSGAYFPTLGIPLVRGRYFDDRDRADAPPVVMINETMARLHWHGVDPIGRRLSWGVPGPDRWRTIVGVVADAKEGGLEVATKPAMYIPYRQANSDTVSTPMRSLVIVVRAARDPEQLVAPLRATVTAVDPTVAVDGIRTVRQLYAGELAPRRFTTLLITLFGLVALGLAALGLYGVLSHQVAARIPEIGIRLALGARPADVVRRVVGEGLGFTLLGLVVGALLALPLTGLLSNLLFGVGRFDPLTLAGVAAVLGIAALAATYLPARRAARVDPITALRSD